jgi:hypothetical protein
MALRYWVGGTGTWDTTSTANWSATSGGAAGASAPTSADAVLLDANSGAGVITLGENVPALTLTMTGYAGTLDFFTYKISLSGNNVIIFTGVTTATITGTPVIECTYSGSVGTRTISSGAVTEANSISFNITAGTDVVAFGSGAVLRNISYTGFSGSSTVAGRTIYGNLTYSAGMTISVNTAACILGATSGTQQITTNGKTVIHSVTQSGVGGTVQLQDNLTMDSTRDFTLTAGTLDLNNLDLSCRAFQSNNSNTRAIAFGTNGKIVLVGNGTLIVNFTTITGFSYTGTSLIESTYAGSTGQRTITFQSTTTEAQALNIKVSAGADTVQINGPTQNNDFLGFSGTLSAVNRSVFGSFTLSSTMTLAAGAIGIGFPATSGTKNITTNGVVIPNIVSFGIAGSTASWVLQDNLTLNTYGFSLAGGNLNLNDNVLTALTFSSNAVATRSVAFGAIGKMVLTGNAANVIGCATVTGLSITGTSNIESTYAGAVGTRTFLYGSTAGGTEANSVNIKVTAGTDIASVSGVTKTLDFTGFAGSLANTAKTIYGSLTLATGMTLTAGANATTFASTAAGNTITSAGQTQDYPITFNGINGIWTCQDALTLGATRALTMTNGTLNLKAGATSTVGSFVTTGTNQKFLGSSTPGTQATISDASGVNSVSYLTIQDSVATGGADWEAYASNDNTDAGNNLNWDFGATPILGTEYEYKLRSFTQPRRF